MFSLYYIELVQCPEVNDPTNGCAFKEHLVRGIGDIVEYTCSSGYDLVGSYIRTCQPDGTWTKNTPQCIIQLAPQGGCPCNVFQIEGKLFFVTIFVRLAPLPWHVRV